MDIKNLFRLRFVNFLAPKNKQSKKKITRKSRKINAALAAAREAKKNKNLLDIFPTEAITNKKSMILTILNQLLFKCLGSKLATACFLTGTHPTELG